MTDERCAMTTDQPTPPTGDAIDAMARHLHAEHVREFAWMGGTHLSDPVLVEDCGNCQRWARYAASVPDDVMLAELVKRGTLTEERRVLQNLRPERLLRPSRDRLEDHSRRLVTQWKVAP